MDDAQQERDADPQAAALSMRAMMKTYYSKSYPVLRQVVKQGCHYEGAHGSWEAPHDSVVLLLGNFI